MYAIIRAHDPDGILPREGIDVQLNELHFWAGRGSKDFTWKLLFATVPLVEDSLRERGFFECTWWVWNRTSGDWLGQGSMSMDPAAVASSNGTRFRPPLSCPTIITNASTPSVGLPDFQVSVFYGNESFHPLNRHDVEEVFDIAFSRISEHDLGESLPQGVDIAAGNVILNTLPFTPEYTWGFWAETLRQVQEAESSKPNWWQCGWTVVGVDENLNPTQLYAVGQLHPARWEDKKATGDVETAYDNVRVSVRYEEPPHPLNRQDAEGVFDLAFLRISQRDPDDRMPRRGAEIRAGNVILDTSVNNNEEYTWRLWEYTLRQLQAAQSSAPPGWWSCSFDVVGIGERGMVRMFYASGRLYSAVGEGEKGPGDVEVA